METTVLAPFDVQLFCDDSSTRYVLGNPFVKRGWLCGTDGAIAVLVAAPGELDTVVDGKLPDVPGVVLLHHEGNHQWRPWPESVQTVDTDQECLKCQGGGFAHVKDCEECNGRGELKCSECGHEYDCKDCQGEGTIGCGKCPACNGQKHFMQPYSCEVSGRQIKAKYERAIRSIPGVEFTLMENGILFRAPGDVRGIVMALCERGSNDEVER